MLENVLELVEKALVNITQLSEEEIEKVKEYITQNTQVVAVDDTDDMIENETPEEVDNTPDNPEEELVTERPPRQKKQKVVITIDKDGNLPEMMTGWVVEIPDNENPDAVFRKLTEAGVNFNNSKKGRKYPVSMLSHVFDGVTRKFLKEQDITVKTKDSIYILPTKNYTF